jgi:hypothetical protein
MALGLGKRRDSGRLIAVRKCPHTPCRALSAASANSVSTSKNSFDWPLNNPMAVKNFRAPVAAPVVSISRMIEQTGNFRSKKYGPKVAKAEILAKEGRLER